MSNSKNTNADQQILTVPARTAPIGVGNSGDSKAWKINHPMQFSIEGLMDVNAVLRKAFTKGAVIAVQDGARKAWTQAGNTVDNSTPAKWEAHLSSFLSKPITADVLDQWLPEPKQSSSAKADKQVAAKLDKADATILQMYNNGMRVQQLANKLGKYPSDIIGVLLKRKAKIHEQDKAIVDQFQKLMAGLGQ